MICTRCHEDQEPAFFSPQKTKPHLKYSWCDSCRHAQKADNRSKGVFKKSINNEYRSLKEKAKSLRKLSPEQCKEIKSQADAGIKIDTLALQYKVSPNTIRRAKTNYA